LFGGWACGLKTMLVGVMCYIVVVALVRVAGKPAAPLNFARNS